MVITTIFAPALKVLEWIFTPIKKYFNQPKLYLDFERQDKFKQKGNPSKKNKDNILYTDMGEQNVLFHFSISWNYTLSIRNNSEHSAYNIRLIKPSPDYHSESKTVIVNPAINEIEPILINEVMRYNLIFREYFEATDREINNYFSNNLPEMMNDIIILEYTNVQEVKFYTVYDNNLISGKNKHYKTLPKEYLK